MKTTTAIAAAAALYFGVIIFTFGSAINKPSKCERPDISDIGIKSYLEDSCENLHGMSAFMASVFWPFYWSAELQAGDA